MQFSSWPDRLKAGHRALQDRSPTSFGEIAQTVSSPAEVEEDIGLFIAAVGG